jgi:hypothetical protein
MLGLSALVAAGLLVFLLKASMSVRIWIVSHPLTIDTLVFFILIGLHWGTFSGVMVASIAAFLVSLVLWVGRWFWGHTEGGKYHPGFTNVGAKL